MKLITEEVIDIQYLVEDNNKGGKDYFIEGIFMQAEKKNRNGRVYPHRILAKEVERYNKEYVNENRALGELGHPACFSTSAEILTEDGWKKIEQVQPGDSVYTLNMSGVVELQKTTATYNAPYRGKMISIKGRGFDTLVTPNHRFLIEQYNKNRRYFATAQDLFDNSENFGANFSHSFIPKTHNTTDIHTDTNKFITIGEHDVDIDVFAEFFALYLAEGCTIKRKGRKNSYLVSVFQKEGEKADIIREILSRLPWAFRENTRKTDKLIRWTTHDNALAHYLYPLGMSHEKYIPIEFIQKLNSHTASSFLDVYVMGDGRGKRNKKFIKSDVFSTSERMIEGLSHIAFIAGQATRQYYKEPTDSRIGDRIIKKENKRHMHFLQLLTTKGKYLDSRFINLNEVDFDGTVHCVTVPNGTFYVKDGGYSFWTGNSPTINLDRVSHMITKLYPDGNNFIGKAKIMDTPNGKIVKSLLDGGVKLGVSTRGVGSLKPANGYQLVQDDFHLATAADIVADPSAPDAFVRGLMENCEWILVNGKWTQQHFDTAKKMIKEAHRNDIEDVALKVFHNFISKL